MRSIAISNHKGGVGKTTTTLNLGAGLHRLGKKVLLIDVDPQAHLTYSMGIQAHELGKTVNDLLAGELKCSDVIINRIGLDLIPSSLDLHGTEKRRLMAMENYEYLLKNALSDLKGYDYILIDCPPALGIFTLNALAYANEIFVPLQSEFLSLQGMSKLLKWVKAVKNRYNKDLEITGIIATRFDMRRKLNQEVLDKVKTYFRDKVFNTKIRENISIAEAPSYGQSIFEYSSGSHGAEDYLNLSKEVMEKGVNYV